MTKSHMIYVIMEEIKNIYKKTKPLTFCNTLWYIFALPFSDVGFTLRKDNPNELKQLILNVQAKAASAHGGALTDQSRVRFMLDIVMAIKNNNMRKIPNYDPEHLDHLRKLIKGFIRGMWSCQLNFVFVTLKLIWKKKRCFCGIFYVSKVFIIVMFDKI